MVGGATLVKFNVLLMVRVASLVGWRTLSILVVTIPT